MLNPLANQSFVSKTHKSEHSFEFPQSWILIIGKLAIIITLCVWLCYGEIQSSWIPWTWLCETSYCTLCYSYHQSIVTVLFGSSSYCKSVLCNPKASFWGSDEWSHKWPNCSTIPRPGNDEVWPWMCVDRACQLKPQGSSGFILPSGGMLTGNT